MDEFDPYWRVWLRHWQALVNPGGPDWTDEFDTAGMINDLWNDRERLAKCLAPLPRAEALVSKVNEIIDTTLACCPGYAGGYFVVRHPHPASDDELLIWTTQFYRRCRQLTGEPNEMPDIRIVRCQDPGGAFLSMWKDSDNEPHDRLSDWLGDTISERCSIEERAAYHLLDEALYTMACFYELAHYVKWVFLENEVEGPNPYRPQFDLWRSGSRDLYRPDEPVRVFAPPAGA